MYNGIHDLCVDAGRFRGLNCELLGLSIDSTFSHIAWLRTIREKVEFRNYRNIEVTFPVISDLTMDVSRAYGMLQPAASTTQAVRAVSIIDPESKVRAILYYPLSNGRNFQEIKRLLAAIQTSDKYGVATPAIGSLAKRSLCRHPAPVEQQKSASSPKIHRSAASTGFFASKTSINRLPQRSSSSAACRYAFWGGQDHLEQTAHRSPRDPTKLGDLRALCSDDSQYSIEIQSWQCRRKSMSISPSPGQENRSKVYDVVAFGAHPDDLEAVMGGASVKLVQCGHSVLFVDLERWGASALRPTWPKRAASHESGKHTRRGPDNALIQGPAYRRFNRGAIASSANCEGVQTKGGFYDSRFRDPSGPQGKYGYRSWRGLLCETAEMGSGSWR